jgi:hypothetical protein
MAAIPGIGVERRREPFQGFSRPKPFSVNNLICLSGHSFVTTL